MLSFRNDLLQTFGIEHEYTAIINEDIQIQHSSEPEPFAEIITNKKGRTTLRVGKLLPHKAPVIKIR